MSHLTRWRRAVSAEEGQALVEMVLALAVTALLIVGVMVMAWWWWNQYTAAAAIQDGVAEAAFYNGNTGAGLLRVQDTLNVFLGGFAPQGGYQIQRLPDWRAVQGQIHYTIGGQLGPLPFPDLEVRASAFKRYERFYGGPPVGGFE
ncbi:MAG: pilus assembly protein [Chloroflexi bacterium]|nr:pilus assembly protein [Chloroflexota bacterium]MBU1748786.1 pilus assembly protein [Chloroflexota bacterium]